MAFAMSRLRSSMGSYTEALKYFENCTPWRGESAEEERPLQERRVRHMGVRKTQTGDIIFRLHWTDVVTWHPDNRVTVRPYTSRSTDAFANGFTPYGLYCSFASSHVSVRVALQSSGQPDPYRIYRTGETPMCFQIADEGGDNTTAQLVSGHKPFSRASVNRQRASVARKLSGLKDFKTWLTAADAMAAPVTWDAHNAARHYHENDLLALLADRDQWTTLREITAYAHTSTLERLDLAVLKLYGCLDVTEYEYFTRHSEYDAMKKANLKFGHYD